jgi:hypothetical protein
MGELAGRLELADAGPSSLQMSRAIAEQLAEIIQVLGPELAQAREEMNKDKAGAQPGNEPAKPIVPPTAEVKLLRHIQQSVLEATRQVEASQIKAVQNPALIDARLKQLSTEQGEAAMLVRKLIDRLLAPPEDH